MLAFKSVATFLIFALSAGLQLQALPVHPNDHSDSSSSSGSISSSLSRHRAYSDLDDLDLDSPKMTRKKAYSNLNEVMKPLRKVKFNPVADIVEIPSEGLGMPLPPKIDMDDDVNGYAMKRSKSSKNLLAHMA